MISMYIGSGDTTALLSGRTTKGHIELLRRFVSGVVPYYNALASPIDALRTGAILEDCFYLTLPDGWYQQVKVECSEMDCLRSSLDFARLDGGLVTEFIEFKSVYFTDYLDIEALVNDPEAALKFIRKTYKNYYNQIQQQLLCSGLDRAKLVFVCVYEYDDNINIAREIVERDYLTFIIERDDVVIARIRQAAEPFQILKDIYSTKN